MAACVRLCFEAISPREALTSSATVKPSGSSSFSTENGSGAAAFSSASGLASVVLGASVVVGAGVVSGVALSGVAEIGVSVASFIFMLPH